MRLPQHAFRGAVLRTGLGTALAFLLVGCATPDLKPFAEATGTLKSSVKTGGDLVIGELARQTITDGKQTFAPGQPNHPAAALETSWELRRGAMEAVGTYGASLAAIADAAEHGKANAAEVVGAVKDLASNVPGFGTGLSAAGDLLVFVGKSIIEVKAHHDMSRAVNAAQPVVRLVTESLEKDFESLAIEYESVQRKKLKTVKDKAEKPREYYDGLLKRRETLRVQVTGNESLSADSEAILKIDQLLAGVEPEVLTYDKEIADQAAFLKDGVRFYREARDALGIWLKAHEDLQRALKENRRPNVALLMSRAEELKGIIDRLRKHQP